MTKLKLSFEEYKKIVESIKYKDFYFILSDIAKYTGELQIEYKYKICCPNWKSSSRAGYIIVFLSKKPLIKSTGRFEGFKELLPDLRYQYSKEELYNWLKKVADNVRYNK